MSAGVAQRPVVAASSSTLQRHEKRAEIGKAKPKSDNFSQFASRYFTDGGNVSFTRKDLKQPLLQQTPDSEKEAALLVWRVMLRFLGDAVDYRFDRDESNTHQPDMGPVMSRMYAKFGMKWSERDLRRAYHADTQEEVNKNMAGRKRGGTLRRLKATITRRLFKEPGKKTIFHDLPIEETLLSPLDKVHYIIGWGIIRPSLRDEIICQICRQLAKNPYKTSIARGWLLLYLSLSCFSPSEEILPHIADFIDTGPQLYAPQCKKIMARTQENGSRFQPPSMVEVEAAIQKKPIELSITMMDGNLHTFVVDGATTSRELCSSLCQTIGLNDSFGFSTYIAMTEKVASLGNGSDHVMDAISQCEQIHHEKECKQMHAPFRFFFRKEFFAPWTDYPLDKVAINLTFAQIVRGITMGEYPCNQDAELATLAAQQYFIEYGAGVSEDSLKALVPAYIPEDRCGEPDSIKRWAREIVKAHRRLFNDKLKEKPAQAVKNDVVNYARKKWSMGFSRFYDGVQVAEGPSWDGVEGDLSLAVNWTGVYVLTHGRVLHEISYSEITSISGDNTASEHGQSVTFLMVRGSAIKFQSTDADDIRHLMTYILDGLRQRSQWAVVTHDQTSAVEDKQDLIEYVEGDLIHLLSPAKEAALKLKKCLGQNERTGLPGKLLSQHLYVLPSLEKPTLDVLKYFRQPGYNALPTKETYRMVDEEKYAEKSPDPTITGDMSVAVQNIPQIAIIEATPEEDRHSSSAGSAVAAASASDSKDDNNNRDADDNNSTSAFVASTSEGVNGSSHDPDDDDDEESDRKVTFSGSSPEIIKSAASNSGTSSHMDGESSTKSDTSASKAPKWGEEMANAEVLY